MTTAKNRQRKKAAGSWSRGRILSSRHGNRFGRRRRKGRRRAVGDGYNREQGRGGGGDVAEQVTGTEGVYTYRVKMCLPVVTLRVTLGNDRKFSA